MFLPSLQDSFVVAHNSPFFLLQKEFRGLKAFLASLMDLQNFLDSFRSCACSISSIAFVSSNRFFCPNNFFFSLCNSLSSSFFLLVLRPCRCASIIASTAFLQFCSCFCSPRHSCVPIRLSQSSVQCFTELFFAF